jgi:anti-sigma-K factor RskA
LGPNILIDNVVIILEPKEEMSLATMLSAQQQWPLPLMLPVTVNPAGGAPHQGLPGHD